MGTLIGEIVAFFVILVVLYRYVWPPVKRLMDGQKSKVQQQLDDAQAARERLEAAEAKYHEALQAAENEAARIRDDARADAERIAREMREQAEAEVRRIRERGDAQTENIMQQVVRELRAQFAQRAVSDAGELVRHELDDDRSRSRSVDSFLDELEGMSRTSQTSPTQPTGT